MKIAFLNDTFLVGRGADQVIYELAKRIGKKYKVYVLASEADFSEENFKIKKVKAQKLLTGTWKDFLFFKNALAYRKAAKKYDVINLHHGTLNIALKGLPNVVVTYHGSPKDDKESSKVRKKGREIINAFGVKSLKKVSKIIAISEYIKKELIKKDINHSKIKVIYDGVSDVFVSSGEDDNFMLYVGRLEKHKRVEKLIQLSKDLNFKLKIVGYGPEVHKLKKLAKGMIAPCEFYGKVSQEKVLRLYQTCSFFASASNWEGFGLIFLEAARCAKPSLAFKVAAIPEVVFNKSTGFLAKNDFEFSEYAKILINYPDLRKEMGEKALAFSQGFSWDSSAKEYQKVFEEIYQKSSPR